LGTMRTHTEFFWGISAVTFAAWVLSGALIIKHLRAPEADEVCWYTIRIISIVPLYSLEGLLALIGKATRANRILDLLRKGYECIVVVAFAQLLTFKLGGVRELTENLEESECHHILPVSFILPRYSWAPPKRFVRRTLICLLQYVPCALLLVFMMTMFWPVGMWIKPLRQPLEFLIQGAIVLMNGSQLIAMYGLIAFYHANRVRLAPMRPVLKMASIKILLFFTFWQEMIVHLAMKRSFFDRWAKGSVTHWSSEDIAEGILNGMLCIEMFLLALAHHWVYAPETVPLQQQQSADGSEGQEGQQPQQAQQGQEVDAIMQRSGVRALCKRFCGAWKLLDTVMFYDDLLENTITEDRDTDARTLTTSQSTRFCCCRFW